MMEKVIMDGFNNSVDTFTKNAMEELCAFYDELDITGLQMELMYMPRLKKGGEKLSMSMVMDIVQENVEYVKEHKNVSALINLLLINPATVCTAERSFSSLRFLKSIYRSTMTNKRLNALALGFVHRDRLMEVDPVDVLREFVFGQEIRIRTFGNLSKK